MDKFEEKIIKPKSGILMLIVSILMLILCTPVFIIGVANVVAVPVIGIIAILASLAFLFFGILNLCGLHQVNPNEALVLVLFGKYFGTVVEPGYYFVNPFARPIVPASTQSALDLALEAAADSGKSGKKDKISAPSTRKRISLKVNTLNNDKQKVNDVLGNPVIIGTNVIWKVANPTKAVFNVEDYSDFLSTQCDLVVRNVARLFPYDDFDDTPETTADGEKTLRGSSQEIADLMQEELQKRVVDAGLEIQDVRITNLAYSEEIAAAMLQRQQASAIIAARQKIVEGAVGMVKMALDQLDEDGVVVLDDERKAAMVSNLLVVLCGNKDAQPVINNGSIY
ncbi:MAG: SPFH domain-containing protein [Clostridiales bacterium]|nr:SPFH domain-containing protein [Candidatus Crickella caballi]